MAGSRRSLMLALGALSAFGPISLDVYLPSLPQLGADLGASDSLTQATMSACMIGLALGSSCGDRSVTATADGFR